MTYDNSPDKFANATSAGGDVYYGITVPEDGSPIALANILVWHWCPKLADGGRWIAASVRDHTVVSLEPLELSPSLLWPCCNKHGYIRGGTWVPA